MLAYNLDLPDWLGVRMYSVDMMKEIPDWIYIEASLDRFSIGDEFGERVTSLVKELKSKNLNSVWAKRVALHEVARREAWLRSFLSLSDLGMDGVLLQRFTIFAIERLTEPVRVVEWDNLNQLISGKSVILEHGSYSNVPTMVHVRYVNYGTVGSLGADINVVSLDSATTIHGLKGGGKIVLSDDIRTRFWQHVPGVDIVTVAPDFYASNPRKFWVDETYPILARAASDLTLLCSYGDQVAQVKIECARLVENIDVRIVYRDNWHREFGNSLYPQWTTSQWDRVSEEHYEFEQLARQYLVE